MSDSPNHHDPSLLEELLNELRRTNIAQSDTENAALTKGQRLIRSMVDEALRGDQKMLANVLKFIEKLDDLQLNQRHEPPPERKAHMRTEWEALFYFIGRWRPHIQREIRRLKKENPGAFKGEWVQVRMQDAPWYEDLYD